MLFSFIISLSNKTKLNIRLMRLIDKLIKYTYVYFMFY